MICTQYFLLSIFFILAPTYILADSIKNITEIKIEDEDLKYKDSQKKYHFKKATMRVNNSSWQSIKLKTRGRHCLEATRKCFSIKSNRKVHYLQMDQAIYTKSFILVSLWQDKGYITSLIGHEFFRPLGLFYSKSTYTELFVNQKSLGIYLLIEKAKTSIKREFKTHFIARRNYFSNFEVKYYSKKNTALSKKEYLNALANLEDKIPKKNPIPFLEQRLNTKKYFKWLAINTFLMNGDYSDEVFFFQRNINNNGIENNNYFDIMAWDLDGLFQAPHKQMWNSLFFKRKLKKSLLYSMEIKLDRKILKRSDLYQDFLNQFKTLLEKNLSDQFIVNVFSRVKKQILPYLENPTNLKISALDDKKMMSEIESQSYSKAYILKLLDFRSKLLLTRKKELLKKIEASLL